MGSYPFGYITAIVLQQLIIVGLVGGIVQLLHEQHHLRRLASFQARMESMDMNLDGHEIANAQIQELTP